MMGSLLIVVAACGAAYENVPNTYPNPPAGYPAYVNVKPTLLNINVEYRDTGERVPSNTSCMIGLGLTGAMIIGAIVAPPADAVAWAVFGAGTGAGLGLTLVDCLNRYKITKPAWDVITQCPVQGPVLVASFDDWGKATAYIDMGYCKCSLACQWGFQDNPAPGIDFSNFEAVATRNYYHDGQNHVFGPVTGEPPPPLDVPAMAASMGLPYGGCVETIAHANQCPT